MTTTKRILAVVLLTALSVVACVENSIREEVEIVAVHCEPKGGAPDCLTIVEFPDRTRRARGDVWGVVGDRFVAVKCTDGWWCVE